MVIDRIIKLFLAFLLDSAFGYIIRYALLENGFLLWKRSCAESFPEADSEKGWPALFYL